MMTWEKTRSLLGVVISSWTSSTRKSFWQTSRRKSALCNGHDGHNVDAGDEDAGGNAGGNADDADANDQYHDDDEDGEPAILDSGLEQCDGDGADGAWW